MSLNIQYVSKSFHSIEVEKTPVGYRMTVKTLANRGGIEAEVMELNREQLKKIVDDVGRWLADV